MFFLELYKEDVPVYLAMPPEYKFHFSSGISVKPSRLSSHGAAMRQITDRRIIEPNIINPWQFLYKFNFSCTSIDRKENYKNKRIEISPSFYRFSWLIFHWKILRNFRVNIYVFWSKTYIQNAESSFEDWIILWNNPYLSFVLDINGFILLLVQYM